MDFKYIDPDNVKVGSLVKNATVPNIIFTVSKILCHEVDFDGKKYVCGYLNSESLNGVPFVYKDGNSQYTFMIHNGLHMKHDIYKYSNHTIKNNDRDKFLEYEIGAEGVLLTSYYGAIDRAHRLGVTVYRYEANEGKYLPIPS